MTVPKLRFRAEDGSEFSEWEEKRLGEVCSSLSYGINAPAKKYDGENKYIRITDIDEITHEYLNADVVSPDGKLEEKFVVKENDILFARTGASTGKTYLYNKKDGKLYYAGFLICAHIKSEHDSRFVFYQTLTQKYFSWVKKTSSRSGQPGINSKEYSAFSFFLPSLQEQQKIADFLSTIDSIISSQKEELAAWEQRKKGIMQKLFSQEVRFKADDGSEFPAWEKKRLKEVAEIQRGGSPRPIEKYLTTKSGINWIKIGDAPVNGNRITSVKEKIIPEGLKKSRAVHKGDLLLSNSMSFGRPYILEVDGCIHDGWLVIQDNNICFNKTFLCEYLGADIVVKQYKKMAAGSTVNNLNKDLVGNVLVIIPSLPEQQKIADCLFSIDEVIQKEKEELEKWQELKKGLLQQMFV